MAFGITSIGAYVPRLRLSRAAIGAAHKWMAPGSRGKGSRAFCNWDEDSVTMAVEAGRDCLRGIASGAVDSLVFASTTAPYDDLLNGAIVAGALGLPEAAGVTDTSGSQRAATTALRDLLRRGAGNALLVASDRLKARPASVQEQSYGAGAAAVGVGSGDVLATLAGSASLHANLVDHFRSSRSDFDYVWEERWVRDEGYAGLVPKAVKAALEDAGLSIGQIGRLVVPSPMKGAAAAVAKATGFSGETVDPLEAGCGYAGAAHALLLLAHALETAKPGDRIMVVGFGQGVDVLILEVRRAFVPPRAWRGVSGSLADRLETEDYLRMLSFYGAVQLDWGMRSEKFGKAALTDAYRNAHQLQHFNAGKCPRCAAVQFPQLAYCVSPGCAGVSTEFEAVSLVDEPARIVTFTADWLTYHPAPPLYVGFVQFDNGARVLMETVDATAESVDVGVPVRMVFRIKERDAVRGFSRYFWKATPTLF